MAQLYSTGPVLIYALFPGDTAPVFVGTGRAAPGIEIRPAFEDVHNDLGGSRVPIDRIRESQDGLVTAEMNRYSESFLQRMADRSLSTPGVPGIDTSGEIGSLLLLEGQTFVLWTVFPYAGKGFFTANANPNFGNMPAGYRWLAAYLLGPDRYRIGSATAKSLGCIWHCLRLFDPTIPGNFNTGTFSCYDFDTSAVAGIPIS
jgi:hypothetical protein